MDYFQSGRVLAITYDNFLRFKFENYLASLVESGIKSYLMKLVDEYTMSKYAKYLNKNTDYFAELNISDSSIFIYTIRWMKNGCFIYYSKERCDLRINQHIEEPVKIFDLVVVWLLLIVLVLTSSLVFAYENVRGWLKC